MFTWDELIIIELFVGRCVVSKNEIEKKKKVWKAIKRELVETLIGHKEKK